ncbi:hypothetical protein HHI36_011153 [Cryptolaemus montrouzieri]|uniref:Uncharacterized protein n=1 Tax=Cryptolaemus montrouzieri TaxID=559131 RepID=A0ABD2MKY5_9CUCU
MENELFFNHEAAMSVLKKKEKISSLASLHRILLNLKHGAGFSCTYIHNMTKSFNKSEAEPTQNVCKYHELTNKSLELSVNYRDCIDLVKHLYTTP